MLNFIFSPIIFLLPLFLFPLLIYKWLYANPPSITSEPQLPSPRKLPIIGNLHQLGLFPHRSLQSLSKQYGQLMLLHLGTKPVLIASSAETAREVMKTHDSIFATRPKASIADRLVFGSKDIAFAPYGEYWKQVKNITMVHLLNNKMVESFRCVREEETSLMIEKISKQCSVGSVDLTNVMVTLTNDIICRVALGRKYSDGVIGRKFMVQIRDMTDLLGTFNVGDYIPWLAWVNFFNGLDARVKKAAKEFNEFLEGIVDEHRKKNGYESNGVTGGTDFVDILLEIQRDDSLGFPVQNDTIKALIWDMFVAGTGTTLTLMEWAMSELIRNPKTLKKLQNEVRLIAQGKSEICEDDLVKMHYLKAVIKETLRLHAPAPLLLPREATKNVNLMGYEIKAGTQVFINAWAVGRDPASWEMSEEFHPERFLDSSIDFKGFDFELIPFGAGRRGCPAITFTIAVNELALAKLVHKFNFALPDGLIERDLDMTESYGITLRKNLPLVAVATPYSG